MTRTIYQYRNVCYTNLKRAVNEAIKSYAKDGRYREAIIDISQNIIPINANCSQIKLIFRATNGKKYTRTITAMYVWGGWEQDNNLLSKYQESLIEEEVRRNKK